jgi:hypothetical protein
MGNVKIKWEHELRYTLILLQEGSLNSWRGDESAKTPSDYERACDIDDYIGIIKSGGRDVLVFGDMPMLLGWKNVDPSTLIIYRWISAENIEEISKELEKIDISIFESVSNEIDVVDNNLIIMEAAQTGVEGQITGSKATLIPGKYSVFTEEYHPNKETHFILHLLKRKN